MGYANKEAQREYQREWLRRRREAWFADKSCVECGSMHDLELDHIDPDEKVSHRVWSWSEVRREEELEKCQVLCAQCHLEKTKEDLSAMNTQTFPHGTIQRYRQGCHCEPCTDDLRRWWREHRAKRKQEHSKVAQR